MRPRDPNSLPAGKSHHRRILLQTRELSKRNTKLEQRVAAAVPVATTTTLPTSPYHGQEILYQSAAMLVAGVVWKFRYNADSASSYKWEFRSGDRWLKEVDTAENTSSATATNLATDGPTFASVLPAGEYIARAHCMIGNASATVTQGQLYLDNNGSDTMISRGTLAGTNYYLSLADETTVTVTASTSLKLQYASSASSSVAFSRRKLAFTPVRIG